MGLLETDTAITHAPSVGVDLRAPGAISEKGLLPRPTSLNTGLPAIVPTQAQTLAALRARHPQTFVLALLGCPDAAKASEDACFHLSHCTWHSAMITLMKPDSMLVDIRDQGVNALPGVAPLWGRLGARRRLVVSV